jgi:hypothetical protein
LRYSLSRWGSRLGFTTPMCGLLAVPWARGSAWRVVVM